MADTEKKRVIRSKDERKAEIDKKIKYHEDCIAALKDKKKKLDEPSSNRGKEKGIKRLMTEGKVSDEDFAAQLNMSLDELKKVIKKAAKKY